MHVKIKKIPQMQFLRKGPQIYLWRL